jgi:hypothetical protein
METQLIKQLNTGQIDTQTTEIAQQILDENDVDKVKDLTNLFNLNAQKRNVVRVLKMHDLLDRVTDQVMTRFEKTPDNFSNEDLIKFMQVTENSIEKANKTLSQVEQTPAIQYQQNNQVNINIGNELDRESRQRVTNTVQAILSKLGGKGEIPIITEDEEGDIVNVESEGRVEEAQD